MKVGYCVAILPSMASFRLRVAIPAAHLGCDYEIGTIGNPSFFYKHDESDADLARDCGPYVYDVVNDHFAGKYGQHYRRMIAGAAAVTCGSEQMAWRIRQETYADPIVIDDPYENQEEEPACEGNGILWFGHAANIRSLAPYVDIPNLTVCSNVPHPLVVPWSMGEERRQLATASIVLMTGTPTASSNRVVKALRAGRFVVTPGGVPAWDALQEFIWVGPVQEGIEWALTHREEACAKIEAGQQFLREANSPTRIALRWMDVFASISAPDTSGKRAGSA